MTTATTPNGLLNKQRHMLRQMSDERLKQISRADDATGRMAKRILLGRSVKGRFR